MTERTPSSRDRDLADVIPIFRHKQREIEIEAGDPFPDDAAALRAAQDICYEAFETDRPKEKVEYALSALSIHPGCPDAWNLLAWHWAKHPVQKLGLFRNAVGFAEARLSSDGVQEDYPYWKDIETRPYMRSLQGLTETLWDLHERSEAMHHAWRMLGMNPDDNQGIRYRLIGWLLAEGDAQGANHLLSLYPEDGFAGWAWSRVLLELERNEPFDWRPTLSEAMAVNAQVSSYLLGVRRLPKRLPDFYASGDESEAIIASSWLIEALRAIPNGRKILRQRIKSL